MWVLEFPDNDPEMANFGRIYFAEIICHFDNIILFEGLIELVILSGDNFGGLDLIRAN